MNTVKTARRAGLLALIGALLCALGCPKTDEPAEGTPAPTKTATKAPAGGIVRIAMIPKLVTIPYFKACQKGAEEAAKELGTACELKYDGPTEAQVERQVELVEGFIDQGYKVIAVASNDPEAISASLMKAKNAGAIAITWDTDANAEASGRTFFVNQVRPKDIGYKLMDEMARQAGEDAAYAIVSGTHTAANQLIWRKFMEERRKAKYPKMKELAVEHPGEDQAKATQAAEALIKRYPEMKGLFGITSAAFPAVAEAVSRAKKQNEIHCVGLAMPSETKDYVKGGIIENVILWNAVDLGYLTVYAAHAVASGTLKPGDKTFKAGRLGEVAVEGDQIVLGPPLVFTKENIEQYDF